MVILQEKMQKYILRYYTSERDKGCLTEESIVSSAAILAVLHSLEATDVQCTHDACRVNHLVRNLNITC